jgi:hypothetical protein
MENACRALKEVVSGFCTFCDTKKWKNCSIAKEMARTNDFYL